jgi:hypothetical protein
MNDNTPIFSRCSVGKNRWFWVVYPFDDGAVGVSGFAASALAAEEQARLAGHERYGKVPWQAKAYHAAVTRCSEMSRRRAAQKTKTQGE